MTITAEQTKKVLVGNATFSQFGFSMLITRLKTMYSQNPTSDTLKVCTNEINAFLTKFQKIMAADFAIISKL